MNIGFIGAGNLAQALCAGLNGTDFFNDNSFFAFDINQAGLRSIGGYGVAPLSSAKELIETCGVVVLAVKPKDFSALLGDNSDCLKAADPLLVSVAAGMELSTVGDYSGYDAKIARIMPNINARVRGAVTACCFNERVSQEEKTLVKSFCSSFGSAFEIDESLFAVFGVIGGCSPAFTYMYVDALARAAVKAGMNKKLALQISAAAVEGSARLVSHSDEHPYELVDRVCSPGGTTIEGVAKLKEHGFEFAIDAAVEASCRKDRQMRENN